MPPFAPVSERFARYFVVGAADACWLWTGAVNKVTGYGVLNIGRGTTEHAHVLAFTFAQGPVPKGKQVLHTCHTRPCVNPRHLYAGKHRNNMRDMARALRAPNTKTTWEDRREMLRLIDAGGSMSRIAGRYGITPQAVAHWDRNRKAVRHHFSERRIPR